MWNKSKSKKEEEGGEKEEEEEDRQLGCDDVGPLKTL